MSWADIAVYVIYAAVGVAGLWFERRTDPTRHTDSDTDNRSKP